MVVKDTIPEHWKVVRLGEYAETDNSVKNLNYFQIAKYKECSIPLHKYKALIRT